ncbi:MAG TPA: hypothetical protein VI895_12455, partial [Bdellovibrionota bacterium]|nr:hypothetical protein [Bdellovibrionota bacterium]
IDGRELVLRSDETVQHGSQSDLAHIHGPFGDYAPDGIVRVGLFPEEKANTNNTGASRRARVTGPLA